MKILKPNWVHHDGQAIYSIDIHPDGSRLATSGLGDDNGKIIIWNMAPIKNQLDELNENIPKTLCQMEYHLGCVNAVRWSSNGQYLASGSDDKLIMIWQYSQMAAYQNIENWKCTYTLRGHDGDVLDLAWSPKDQYLASCSVDNTIIIWNAFKFPEIIKRINAHNGFVKGVSWDPIGKYLASQSDDKTLKIWCTSDWSLEKVIDEPFKQCGSTTHILRLNWSTDGQLLISANAIKDEIPIAKIIERDTWKTHLDLVGHRKAVTIVKFYPKILKETTDTVDRNYCLYALGSRDRSISIWLTSSPRPLAILYDLFESPIVDITWSRDESISLLCCSEDGTVVFIEFNNLEIGYPLTKYEHETFFKIKYSYDLTSIPDKTIHDKNDEQKISQNCLKFIENVDVLFAQEQKQDPEQIKTKQQVIKPLFVLSDTDSSNSQFKSNEVQKQIERRLPDGRRRITPICIARTIEYETPKPFNNSNIVQTQEMRSQTATEQSEIIVEKRNEYDEIIEVSPIKSVTYAKLGGSNSSHSNDTSNFNAPILFNKQNKTSTDKLQEPVQQQQQASETQVPQQQKTETQKSDQTPTTNLKPLKSETKISTPALTTLNQSTPKIPSKPPQPQLNNKSLVNSSNSQLINQNKANPNKSQQLPQSSSSTTNQQNKLNNSSTTNNAIKKPPNTPSATNSNNQLTKQKQIQNDVQIYNHVNHTDQNNQKTNDDSFNKSKQLPKQISNRNHSLIQLTPLKMENRKTTKIISTKTSNRPSIELEVENFVNDSFNLNLLKYIKDNQLKWKSEFLNEICAISYSTKIIACSCKDHDLYLLTTTTGTQICSPIILDDCLAFLKCNLNYCMCITCNGYLYVWYYDDNDSLLKIFIKRQSCLAIFKDGHFVNATITDNGQPIVYTSNNRSYYYSLNTQCWHQIPTINNNLAINSFIELNHDDNSISSQLAGPLSMAQLGGKNDVLKTIDKINQSNARQDFTLKNLESQINASIGLNSAKEYKFWLITYARYLSDNLYEDKLRELCNSLLGPLYSIKWNPLIMNIKKRDLLNEVLDIIGKNLNLQRLYTSYKQQLNISNRSDNETIIKPSINSSSNPKIPKLQVNGTDDNHINNDMQTD